MADKKDKSKDKGGHAPLKTASKHPSPQAELIEKARHDPELGRKPPKDAVKKTVAPTSKKTRRTSWNTKSEALGSTTDSAKKRQPKHKNPDTSGQDLNE